MIRSLFFAALALVAASPASAQSWQLVTLSGKAPQRATWFVDSDSIAIPGTKGTIRTQTIYEGITDDRDFDRSVHKREVDCSTITSTIIDISYYVGGSLISSDQRRGNTVTHQPGSVMYAVVAAACRRSGYIQGPIADPEGWSRKYFAAKP
ncbi:surface-adhesin E family protein [Sphingomonas canadensis]|uniref:Surface-adhesin E family protein n=1 Tax=Sphingomonas canadensis TaxID=1219257 RepID=A0ABW3H6M2_9SPHN|nr:surface-adhesin E family protein [Sphingomonas canadensis]MCW3836280.1 hypothetical protein [Sphingomonas canadensis]